MALTRKNPGMDLYNEYKKKPFKKLPAVLRDWNNVYGDDDTGGFGFLRYLGLNTSLGLIIVWLLCIGIGFGVIAEEGFRSSEGWWIVGIYDFIMFIYLLASSINWHHKKCGMDHRKRYKYRPFTDYDKQKPSLSQLYIRAYTTKEEHESGLLTSKQKTDGEKLGNALDILRPEVASIIKATMKISSWSEVGEDREAEMRRNVVKFY